MNRLLVIGLFCLGILAALPIQAQESKLEWEADIGLLLRHDRALIDNLKGYDEINLNVLLTGGVYYEGFFAETAPLTGRPFTLGYTLSQQDSLQINLIAESLFIEISEDAQDGSGILDGIKTRRSSMEFGVELLKSTRNIEWQFRVMHDGLDRHHGTVVEAKLAYPIFTTSTLIVPAFGLTYIDENAVNFYFGVDEDEVRPDRPVYSTGGSWVATARTYLEHPINESWSLVGSAAFIYFSDNVKDSPIVSRNDVLSLQIGVLWSF